MNEGGNALRSRPMGNYSYSFEIVHNEENEKESYDYSRYGASFGKSIPDVEKDVGIKNVGNKGFPDAVNNASGDASRKQSFPTHHEGIGKNTSGKGTETERGKERRSRDRRRDFRRPSAVVPPPSVVALPRRCPSPPSATLAPIEHEEEIEEFRLEDEMAMNVGLMHVKVLNGWSNKSFDMLLELLRAAFPMCNSTIPNSFYEAKRKLRHLGLGYETIHTCKYDCVLYWKEFADLQHCPTCGEARRRAQSRLLELKRHVAINRCISMTIAPGAEKPISPHVVCFSQAIGVCVRKTFPVRCLKWADVGREYIKVVKGDLQRLFVLDFNDQAMNRFVEHQMLTTFKEFRVDCHRHFKKYSDPEEARANPPNALVGRDED
ncbi:CACTA en-spm transposon protein [Cucumis melo var. makuwa]|uniref:CACTA en-spm transposon protein n=1 Tax=Cucumis melo var. makuwa TaxID=1194695 RepID=A0A5A7UEC5_CUCMM|nr:CACTA en-spm transposon protein [Cucumis melo var. makuwa]